jgi:hypothetical protein
VHSTQEDNLAKVELLRANTNSIVISGRAGAATPSSCEEDARKSAADNAAGMLIAD